MSEQLDAYTVLAFVRANTIEDLELLVEYLEDMKPKGSTATFKAGYEAAIQRVRDLIRELS
jgi:hypothetical protein